MAGVVRLSTSLAPPQAIQTAQEQVTRIIDNYCYNSIQPHPPIHPHQKSTIKTAAGSFLSRVVLTFYWILYINLYMTLDSKNMQNKNYKSDL